MACRPSTEGESIPATAYPSCHSGGNEKDDDHPAGDAGASSSSSLSPSLQAWASSITSFIHIVLARNAGWDGKLKMGILGHTAHNQLLYSLLSMSSLPVGIGGLRGFGVPSGIVSHLYPSGIFGYFVLITLAVAFVIRM